MDAVPKVLSDYDPKEAISLKVAAGIANRSQETLREWASMKDLGRKVGGRWMISHPALLMYLESDAKALKAYWQGDRSSPLVSQYFSRAGLSASQKGGR
jgi:hypothetical protein